MHLAPIFGIFYNAWWINLCIHSKSQASVDSAYQNHGFKWRHQPCETKVEHNMAELKTTVDPLRKFCLDYRKLLRQYFDKMPGHPVLIHKDIILVHAVRFTLRVVFCVKIQQISSATFFRLCVWDAMVISLQRSGSLKSVYFYVWKSYKNKK